MKRIFAKLKLMSFLTGFFLFGLMLTANRSAAQANWMPPAEAQQVLLTELDDLNVIMANNGTGTPVHIDALLHAYYYKEIYTRLDEGKTTEDAAKNALSIFTDSYLVGQTLKAADSMTDNQTLGTKTLLDTLFNDAVALLTQ